ncbi:hypothetical protein M0812_02873 [Anaeramoeba flamelloides]|uniref:Uncharacterized protein n=1 Tax=Anaeramoeba flamelloides TaxID=1746091 RepID=A0AAV7YR77_9EUKA|nr:hypothetical protein M0812_02873 [Anaeramoeba flamelloides]
MNIISNKKHQNFSKNVVQCLIIFLLFYHCKLSEINENHKRSIKKQNLFKVPLQSELADKISFQKINTNKEFENSFHTEETKTFEDADIHKLDSHGHYYYYNRNKQLIFLLQAYPTPMKIISTIHIDSDHVDLFIDERNKELIAIGSSYLDNRINTIVYIYDIGNLNDPKLDRILRTKLRYIACTKNKDSVYLFLQQGGSVQDFFHLEENKANSNSQTFDPIYLYFGAEEIQEKNNKESQDDDNLIILYPDELINSQLKNFQNESGNSKPITLMIKLPERGRNRQEYEKKLIEGTMFVPFSSRLVTCTKSNCYLINSIWEPVCFMCTRADPKSSIITKIPINEQFNQANTINNQIIVIKTEGVIDNEKFFWEDLESGIIYFYNYYYSKGAESEGRDHLSLKLFDLNTGNLISDYRKFPKQSSIGTMFFQGNCPVVSYYHNGVQKFQVLNLTKTLKGLLQIKSISRFNSTGSLTSFYQLNSNSFFAFGKGPQTIDNKLTGQDGLKISLFNFTDLTKSIESHIIIMQEQYSYPLTDFFQGACTFFPNNNNFILISHMYIKPEQSNFYALVLKYDPKSGFSMIKRITDCAEDVNPSMLKQYRVERAFWINDTFYITSYQKILSFNIENFKFVNEIGF